MGEGARGQDRRQGEGRNLRRHLAVGGVTEQASNVKAGKVDIALGLRGAEGDQFLGSSVIELPFLVPDALRGSQALWGLYQDGTLAEEYKDYKVLALFVHNPGLIHTKEQEGPRARRPEGRAAPLAQQHRVGGARASRRRAGACCR